jgi:hypothetical protein
VDHGGGADGGEEDPHAKHAVREGGGALEDDAAEEAAREAACAARDEDGDELGAGAGASSVVDGVADVGIKDGEEGADGANHHPHCDEGNPVEYGAAVAFGFNDSI